MKRKNPQPPQQPGPTVQIAGARFESDRDIPPGTMLQFFLANDGTLLVYCRREDRRSSAAICRMEGGLAVIPDAPFFGPDEPPTFVARDAMRHKEPFETGKVLQLVDSLVKAKNEG